MPTEILEIYIPFLIGYIGTLTEFKRKPVNDFKAGDTKRLGITWELFCQTADIHKKPCVYEHFITLKIDDVVAIINHLWKQIDEQNQYSSGLGVSILDWMLDNSQRNDEPRFVFNKATEHFTNEPTNLFGILGKYMQSRREIMKKYIDVGNKQYTSDDIAKVSKLEQLIIHNNWL